MRGRYYIKYKNLIIGLTMEMHTSIINLMNTVILKIQLILKPTKLMNIDNLITENSQDVNLRIDFLKQVINNNKKIDKTRYYNFFSIPKGDGLKLDPVFMSKEFIKTYNSIKKYGFKGYFIVAKITRFNHVEIPFNNYRKILKEKIKFKYQPVGAAHRLAICKFLGYKEIPVKIVITPFLNFPDFTSFIKRYKI